MKKIYSIVFTLALGCAAKLSPERFFYHVPKPVKEDARVLKDFTLKENTLQEIYQTFDMNSNRKIDQNEADAIHKEVEKTLEGMIPKVISFK